MKALSPKNLDELVTALNNMTDKSKIIGGGTDLIISIQRGRIEPDCLLLMNNVQESRKIEIFSDRLEIGSSVTMTEIAESQLIPANFSAIREAASDVGSLQVRNRATIGGNIANASPAGDLIPVLYLLNAQAHVLDNQGQTTKINIENLITGAGQTCLNPQQAIYKFEIPLTDKITHFIKMGSRSKVTVARINLTAALNLNDNNIITDTDVIASSIYTKPLNLKAITPSLRGLTPDDPAAAQFISRYITDFINENTHRVYKAAAVKGVALDLMAKFQ